MSPIKSFSAEAKEKLRHYVYRLMDPRNGETFYVGVGKDNRVFQHAFGKLKENEENSLKMDRIRQIRKAGFEVSHIIHRHGMDKEETALEVEAALIDVYPGLANIQGGRHSGDYGVMHADEIEKKYKAEFASFQHKILLLDVNHTSNNMSLYEAVSYAWRVGDKREEIEFVAAVVRGVIYKLFSVEKWLEATRENFPDREPMPGRYGFRGKEAPEDY